jgi:hypothetical protein
MFDGPGPNLIGNAQEPQQVDYRARAFGFGLVLGVVGLSTSTPAGAEYQYGTHAVAIYESQFKGVIFSPTKGGVPADAVRSFTAAPQTYDFTLQASFQRADTFVNQSTGISAEYQFGTHAVQLANSQIQSHIFPSLVGATTRAPLKTIIVNGQELSRDLTIQAFLPFVPVPTGWLITMVTAGPQLADLTIQAEFQQAAIHNIVAPWSPTTIVVVWQQDPTQRAAALYAPPPVAAKYTNPGTIVAAPADARQVAHQASVPFITQASVTPPKPSNVVQPVIIQVPQQFYADVSYIFFSQPVIGGLPLPPLQYPVPVPYSIYSDYQPWAADTNRYTVDSGNTIWSADGGGTGGGTSPPPASDNPNSPKPDTRVTLSITQTLNTRY